jgi:ferritin
LVYLRRHQHWKKLKGMVLLSANSPIYFSNKYAEEWQQMETLVAFPLENGETIETSFIKFVEYDLNARQTFEMHIQSVRYVEIID